MIFLFSRPKSNLLLICASGTKGEKGSWKNECIVTPPALMAATPVGATTIALFLDLSITVFRNVVFPVPAFPVRKILLPVFSTKSHACLSSVFFSIVVVDVLHSTNLIGYAKLNVFFHQANLFPKNFVFFVFLSFTFQIIY